MPKKYENPEDLWEKYIEYEQWLQENPLKEQKIYVVKGNIHEVEVNKMRAQTLKGFCLFAGVTMETFKSYKKTGGQDFLSICSNIEDAIYVSKFEGAAAELLNPNLIAREVGLHDSVKNVSEKPAVHIHTRDPQGVQNLLDKLDSEE